MNDPDENSINQDRTEPLWKHALQPYMPGGVGQPPKFKSPDDLAQGAYAYFEWAMENPVIHPGTGKVAGPQPLTIEGLCIFLKCNRATWYEYKGNTQFSDICARIDDAMFQQSYAAAAAGLLNHAIVARKLGLVDKQEVKNTTANDLLEVVQEADGDVKPDA